MNIRPPRFIHGRRLAFAGLTLFAAGALSAGTADEAVEALWKFVSPQGLLYDFIGDVPTPQDCAENRPNAMGYWCPIENGPMFTGPFLQAMALRAKRTRDLEDARRCRILAEGLLLLASVSDEPGFVARGVGTDGKCHFPIGGPDQTVPWFLGLDAYLHSGLCDAALKARIVAKLKEVGEALAAADWRPPTSDNGLEGLATEHVRGVPDARLARPPVRGARPAVGLPPLAFAGGGGRLVRIRRRRHDLPPRGVHVARG